MPESLPEVEYYTVTEIAKLLRCTGATIRNRIKEGYYPGAIKPGRDWRIPKAEAMNSLNKHYGSK